jgi:hypothetical protein
MRELEVPQINTERMGNTGGGTGQTAHCVKENITRTYLNLI